MTVTIDATLLTSYYAARSGLGALTGGSGSTTTPASTTATPPWSTGTKAAPMSDLVKSVLSGGKYIDSSVKTLGATPASTTPDVKNLFSLYQGLTALEGVAQQAQASNLSPTQAKQYEASFASGLSQLQTFLAADPFKNATIVQGNLEATAQGKVGVKAESDSYSGQTVYTGPLNGEVPAFQGDVSFSMSLKGPGTSGTKTVDFDLSEMGSTPRTMPNVVLYLNSKLEAAGVTTRFANVRTPAAPTTTTVNGTTTTTPAPFDDDSYSLQLTGSITEIATFSSASATPAVYVAQASGTAPTSGTTTTSGTASATTSTSAQQLLKLDGDSAPGEPSQIFGNTLPSYVSAVRSTATGPDGSVYVLADITGPTSDGQTVDGASDVALLKYDSAGGLQYTRTLGSASAAQGFSLAVSADGSQVAVAGAVTGDLDKQNPAEDPTQPSTFVSVFDSQGVEQWTQRPETLSADQPAGVTFGPDGSVYVTGKTSGTVAGGSSQGGQDAYLIGFSATGAPTLSTQFGSSGLDRGVGVVATADGVTVASIENGHAVLRQFAPGSAQPAAVRDLGDLQGGDLAGVSLAADGSIVVAGSTHNGALAAGTVTQAYQGGQDVFVARLSSDLSASPQDTLSYWDAGADASTGGLTVSGGQVYVTGQTTGAPYPGSTTPTHAGYAVAIDPDSGQATWSTTFTGADGQAAPSSIAVDATGASDLDKLGLPSGLIDYAPVTDLIANTSLRPGDQFEVKVGTQAPQAVTIAQGETLSSLAQKINRASGFQATATVVTVNGYQQLKIAPSNARTSLQLLSGPSGQDALTPLGLYEGTVTTAASASATPVSKGSGTSKTISVAKPYALTIPTTLTVADATDAKRAQGLLANALTTVRKAYTDLTTPPAAANASSGTVPAYLTAQIANYQLALARLTGSSSSSSSSTTASLLSG